MDKEISVFVKPESISSLKTVLLTRGAQVVDLRAQKEKKKGESRAEPPSGEFAEYLHLPNQEEEEEAGVGMKIEEDSFPKEIPPVEKQLTSSRKQSQSGAVESVVREDSDGISDDEELVDGDNERKRSHLLHLARLQSVDPGLDFDAQNKEQDQEMEDREGLGVPQVNLIPATGTVGSQQKEKVNDMEMMNLPLLRRQSSESELSETLSDQILLSKAASPKKGATYKSAATKAVVEPMEISGSESEKEKEKEKRKRKEKGKEGSES